MNVKRLNMFETPTAETICIESPISNRKWFIMYAYRPKSIDRPTFFAEINISLSKAKYEYVILAGDVNVDLDVPSSDITGFYVKFAIFLV